jgi:hypothetical protein
VTASLLARRQTVGHYAARRALRLYPTVLLGAALLPLPLLTDTARAGPIALFKLLIWPTNHTYVGGIVPIYAALFIAGRTGATRAFAPTAIALVATFAALNAANLAGAMPAARGARFGPPLVAHFAYAGAAAFVGAWAAAARLSPRCDAVGLLSLGAIGATYLALKFAIVALGRIGPAHAVLFLLALAACAIALRTLGDPRLVEALPMSMRRVARGLALLTLEIYVVHENLLAYPSFARPVFPLNIMALCGVTLVLSLFIHNVAEMIRRRADRKL